MGYLYETHMHTSQASACSRSTGSELVRWYAQLGYRGVIITDHFFGGNCAVDRSLPWRERIHRFCAGYEDALEAGAKYGVDVFFGWEEWYEGDEYLVYGPDKAWLLEHPEMERWTRKEQLAAVHAAGGCVVQAHPFRQRQYIHSIKLADRFVDAVEVGNAGNLPLDDVYAWHYARALGLTMTAGSDCHMVEHYAPEAFMAVELDEPIKSIGDYVRLIRQGGPIGLHVPKGRFDLCEGEPRIATFRFDEQERAVPCTRDWLAE